MASTTPLIEDTLKYMSTHSDVTPTEKIMLLMLVIREDGLTKSELAFITNCSAIQTERAILKLYNKGLLFRRNKQGEEPAYLIDCCRMEKIVQSLPTRVIPLDKAPVTPEIQALINEAVDNV